MYFYFFLFCPKLSEGKHGVYLRPWGEPGGGACLKVNTETSTTGLGLSSGWGLR